MGEALANPVFAQAMQQFMANSPFASTAEGDGLGTDMERMMADFPLAAMVGFTGTDPDEFQQLLDAANA